MNIACAYYFWNLVNCKLGHDFVHHIEIIKAYCEIAIKLALYIWLSSFWDV